MAVIFKSQEYEKYKSSGNDGNPYIYYLTVDELSQDISNNTSTLLFTLYFRAKTGTNTLMWNSGSDANSPYSSILIDGVEYTSLVSNPSVDGGSGSGSYYIHNGTFRRYRRSATNLAICKATLTIPHDNNGEKFISVQFKWYRRGTHDTYDYYPAPFSSNGATVELTKIPRNGILSVSNAILVDTNTIELPYSITSYSDYYYDLSYTLDGNTVTALTKQHIPFADIGSITATWLLEHCSVAQANLVFTLQTYSLSGGIYTQVGSDYVATTVVMINLPDYLPSITMTANVGTTPIAGYLVAGYSELNVSYSVTLSSGANLTSVTFATTYGSFATYDPTQTSGTVRNLLPPTQQSGIDVTVSATIVDSRGATTTQNLGSLFPVWPYDVPEITASAYRVANNGDTNEDGAGTYVYITFSAATYYTVNGNNSIQSITCVDRNNNSYTDPSWPTLTADHTQRYTFTAIDTVQQWASQQTEQTIKVGFASYSLDLYDDGTATMFGAALAGAVAEANKVSLGGTNVQEVSLMASVFRLFNDNTAFLGKQSNSTDADTLYPDSNQCVGFYYRTSNTGSSHWPVTTAYIVLIAYRLTAGAGVQFAWANGSNTVYMRIRSSSTWQNWKSITFA